MSDNATIGRGWNDHLATQVDAQLRITIDPGTYDRAAGKRVGATYQTVSVKAMSPAPAEKWDGTMRREVMQSLIGQVGDGTLNPRTGDHVIFGTQWWRIIGQQPLIELDATLVNVLDVEAVAAPVDA